MTRTTKRLGVIVPSGNVIMEPDMYRMAPPNVSAHFARAVATEDTPEQLAGMINDVPHTCELLSHGNMDVYAFGCTGGSFFGGVGYDQKIIDIMQTATGKPATTTSTAVLDALRTIGVKRISLASPYETWLNERAKNFFQGHGFEVIAMKGFGIVDTEGIAGQTPERIFNLVMEVDRPESEAIFISCTDFRGAEVLDRIETELGKPAISSNQATMWKMLQLAGVDARIKGFGQLLAGSVMVPA
jgi:maleate isomerase